MSYRQTHQVWRVCKPIEGDIRLCKYEFAMDKDKSILHYLHYHQM